MIKYSKNKICFKIINFEAFILFFLVVIVNNIRTAKYLIIFWYFIKVFVYTIAFLIIFIVNNSIQFIVDTFRQIFLIFYFKNISHIDFNNSNKGF